jgi:hypothetical protein
VAGYSHFPTSTPNNMTTQLTKSRMTVAMPLAGIWALTGYPLFNSYLCHDRSSRGEEGAAALDCVSRNDGANQKNVNKGS